MALRKRVAALSWEGERRLSNNSSNSPTAYTTGKETLPSLEQNRGKGLFPMVCQQSGCRAAVPLGSQRRVCMLLF